MKEKTWNVITVSLLLFVALFFIFGVVRDAVAEDDNVILEDMDLMIVACNAVYSTLATALPMQRFTQRAFHWREFYIGWNNNDEEKADAYLTRALGIMDKAIAAGDVTAADLGEQADLCDKFETTIVKVIGGSDAGTFKLFEKELQQ